MPVNVGIVGYNGIGKRHAGCHHEDDLATLVAVCDAVSERAQPAREQYGAAIYGSVPDMLAAHPELDIVDVCTGGAENGGWHFEPVMQALDAGKHVLVEKPLSNDVDEARQMVEFAAQRGRYLGCNLNHYFSEPADRAMDLVRDGKIGEQLYCLMRMGFQGGEYTYSGPDGNANSRGFPYFHVKAFLSHPFAIMRHFCGDITHVQAFMNRPAFRRAASDPLVSVNSIHVRFASDAVGYLFSQRGDTRMGYGGWWSFELGGTRGTFAIENCVEKLIHFPAPGAEGAADPGAIALGSAPEPIVLNTGVTDFGATFPRRIHAFLEDVTNGVPARELRASGRDAFDGRGRRVDCSRTQPEPASGASLLAWGSDRRKRQEFVDGRTRPGSDEAAAKMHARLAELRRVSRRATCKPSASAVERRGRSVEEALHRWLRRQSRSVAVAHSVMSKARQAQVSRILAVPLGDRQQVVDLQQMGRGAAAPGERIAITAASSVALPDVAPDSRGNVAPWRGLVGAVDSIAGRVRRCPC